MARIVSISCRPAAGKLARRESDIRIKYGHQDNRMALLSAVCYTSTHSGVDKGRLRRSSTETHLARKRSPR